MKSNTLGRTGLQVSTLGMGTGGHDPLGQISGRPESEMHALLHKAFDLGINLFDSSPGYLDSELILGRVLKNFPRDEIVVSTKVALGAEESENRWSLTPADDVVATVEKSLQRLQLDELDILQLAPADSPDLLDFALNEQIPALLKMRDAGKFRFLGSSELTRSDGSHEWLKQILPSDAIDVAMVGHNMINQSAQNIVFPLCRQRNIGVINIFTVRNLFWNPARLSEVIVDLKVRGLLEKDSVPDEASMDWLLADGSVTSLVEAAYRYASHTIPVSVVMCGTLDEDELEDDVKFISKGPLPTKVIKRLKDIFGHIQEAIGN